MQTSGQPAEGGDGLGNGPEGELCFSSCAEACSDSFAHPIHCPAVGKGCENWHERIGPGKHVSGENDLGDEI